MGLSMLTSVTKHATTAALYLPLNFFMVRDLQVVIGHTRPEMSSVILIMERSTVFTSLFSSLLNPPAKICKPLLSIVRQKPKFYVQLRPIT